MHKKIIVLFLIASILFSLFSLYSNASDIDIEDTNVDAYLLFDLKNNTTMAQSNCDVIISPSSTTKIMTACIVLESGIDIETEVEITSKVLQNTSGRNMELKVGDKLTVKDLIYAMLCGGYNDATVALAYTITPTLYEFVALMNEKATELSMLSTHYANVTGMETDAAKTTVSDLGILAKYMVQNELFVEICSTKTYKLSEISTCRYATIHNRSSLLSDYSGISNFNTGSSNLGDCCILYYQTNASTLIAIVMNANSDDSDNTSNCAEKFSKKLLSFAKENYSLTLVKTKNTIVASLPVKYSISSKNIDVYLSENIELFLENSVDIEKDLTYDVQIFGNELKAPIRPGDIVGTMTVSHNGVVLETVNLFIKDTVERNGFLYVMDLMKSFILSIWFVMILASILFCVIWTRYRKKNKFRKKKRKRKNKSKKLKK